MVKFLELVRKKNNNKKIKYIYKVGGQQATLPHT
jgi:hypothetical protein